MNNTLHRLWLRLPAIMRAIVVAMLILGVGQMPPGVFLLVGLRLTPDVPWFFLATVLWLYLFWSWLNGRWWPASTSGIRREYLRADRPRGRVWWWSLVAGGLGMVSVLSVALLTGLVARLPRAAYDAPFDLGPFPAYTVVAFFASIALTAGVVEEAAFRGYMISIVQRRHGWPIAILAAAVLFWLVHLSHAYATLAFVPFFMAYSALHGALVYLSRSILPSVMVHALGDLTILPIQYGVVANPLGSSVRLHALSVVGFGAAAALAFVHLRNITSRRPDATDRRDAVPGNSHSS